MSLLQIAQGQRAGGAQTSASFAVSAYADEMSGAAVQASANITVSAPGATQQIEDAVSQVNAIMKAAYGPGIGSVNSSDAVNVTVGDGLGSLSTSGGLGLPSGLPQPTTILQALDQLAQSSNQGVAAAASSLAPRIITSSYGVGYSGSAEDKAILDDSLSSPMGAAEFLDNTALGKAEYYALRLRDSMIYSMAQSFVDDDLAGVDQNSMARFFDATYNGSFTLVRTSALDNVDQQYAGHYFGDMPGQDTEDISSTTNGKTTAWVVVLPSVTESVSASVQVESQGAG